MYALCARVYQNKKRAKPVRRMNGRAEIEKSQKTEGYFRRERKWPC